MALTNADALTKDIYGFVFRNDGTPRFFVSVIINTFCKVSSVCDLVQDLIDYVNDECCGT